VSLDSILYFSPDTWKIWVNGKLFINTKDLKVHSVTENSVTFVWAVDQKAIKSMRMILKMYILDRGVLCLRFIQNKNLTWIAYLLNNLVYSQSDLGLPTI
jgi:hypothetical protein